MIRVDVESIVMATSPAPSVVILRERGRGQEDVSPCRALRIPTGPYEAATVSHALDNGQSERPLTLDTMLASIRALGSRVERVEVSRVEPPVFYATIILRGADSDSLTIDARPTDAIALAILANAPIFVEDDVMNRVGSVPAKQDGDERAEELERFDRFVQTLSPDDF